MIKGRFSNSRYPQNKLPTQELEGYSQIHKRRDGKNIRAKQTKNFSGNKTKILIQ
jgi:hypothetical protein